MLKIAALQHSFKGDRERTLEYIATQIQTIAHNKSAQLIVLQELHSREYFCQSENTKFFDYGDTYHDDIVFFSQLAKRYGVVIVSSLFEKRSFGLYHNTAVVFETNGEIAGIYRKMHIPDDPSFYEKFYFTPGDLGFEPIQTSVGKLGVLICWDQWFPEAARIMALKGAQILIYPTAIGWTPSDSDDEKQRQLQAWITIQRSHSIANGIPVIALNRVGFEADLSGVGEGIDFWGHSFVCSAQGEFLANANTTETNMLCEIDLARSEEVRRIWPFLRDRRIESYTDILKRFCDTTT
ncbi:carbon-nitrogen hydrolase [Helicobacter fennelliae]